MIVKHKDIFFFIEMTILALVAVGYGFSLIPSPAEQKDRSLDRQRVTDLGKIKFAIDSYSLDQQQLPESLSILIASSADPTIADTNINDPKTKNPYTYTILSPTMYQMCATFATDNTNLPEMDDYDNQNYEYSTYRNEFIHKKGTVCFTEEIPLPTPQEATSGGNAKFMPTPTLACLGGGCPEGASTMPASAYPPTTSPIP